MSSIPVTTRHALGWPQGSIRAVLALMVAGLVCALMLIPAGDKPTPIPAYLLYLLFLVLGHYFAARGSARGQPDAWGRQPLWLPRGSIRLILLLSLTGTCIYRYSTDPEGFEEQLLEAVDSLKEVPLLPVVVMMGFFIGVIVRTLIGHQPPAVFQDLEAWLSLIAVLLMAVAALIHLVINPSLTEHLNPTTWEGILAGVVAFYFGERS
jgi:amino acid transporter